MVQDFGPILTANQLEQRGAIIKNMGYGEIDVSLASGIRPMGNCFKAHVTKMGLSDRQGRTVVQSRCLRKCVFVWSDLAKGWFDDNDDNN